MNTLLIKRGADVLQTLYYSLENGEFFMVLVDELRDPVTDQPRVYVPERINILIDTPKKFTLNEAGHFLPEVGSQKLTIQTLWLEAVLSNSGKLLEGESTNAGQGMVSSEIDVKYFLLGLGQPIVMSMVNGRIRKINGYNTRPVYDGAGNVIPWTEEQLAEPAAGNYDTHKADGTPIHPELYPDPMEEPAPEEPVQEEPVTAPEDANTL